MFQIHKLIIVKLDEKMCKFYRIGSGFKKSSFVSIKSFNNFSFFPYKSFSTLTFDGHAYPDFVVVVVVVVAAAAAAVVEKAVKFSVVVTMSCIFDAKSNFWIKSDSI